jgi:dipeptidase
MNEKGLMIGECTCGAKVHPEPEPGKRMFYAAELSRVALERCTTARDAIKTMGDLIRNYGYYGTGDTLLVGDADEAWVMEMCGYSMEGTDGIWVAQRVPDNSYFVAANEFRIRDVRDDDDFLCSDNLKDVCMALGWWDGKEPLDWLPTVSWGEYFHPYYSLRRVWRALCKAKPSGGFPAWVDDGYTRDYPFSVVPDEKLSVLDVAAIYRDHYEGTEFDMTQGVGAGPFGNPARYEDNPDHGDFFNLNTYHPQGAWERPISIYRCGVSWINQARADLPDGVGGVSWIGPGRPVATCFMPFFAGVTSLPDSMETMNLLDFDRDSAWWAFNVVANHANIKYCYMMQDIRRLQRELELALADAVAEEMRKERVTPGDLTNFCERHTAEVLARWWKLWEQLIVKYNCGCLTLDAQHVMEQVGYPTRAWLKAAGYYDGPTSY